ncbi:hypothetical protein MFLO_03028 [Listeria floridensis FSL S10-1187]|uniref:Uncharacterized protein n=1 Tax=Listeria floridensis FSL S10-1187 TaxID=1265817 RepID=A0ABN0RHX8_9LIST|nr:hypothetical protein [Listeria floridensis]EUJ33482.1 hypothetical protein MFLO_03028 [Listeria floridensis FSL S10-1187]
MAKAGNYEMLFFPTQNGLLKVHAYGFNPCGSWGEVVVSLGNETICVKGFNRKKTIMRAIKLHLQTINNEKTDK